MGLYVKISTRIEDVSSAVLAQRETDFMQLSRFFLLLVVFVSAFAACSSPDPEAVSGSEKRYELRGKVVSVDRAGGTAAIDHEAIPGYMDAMTMDFAIKENWVWEELVPGAQIRADLVVDNTKNPAFWLEKISIVAAADPNTPQPEAKPPEIIGKSVPDVRLTNQDSRQFSLRDYNGKALGLTFIYGRCPLPAYCIRMSQNFSSLALRLNKDPELRQKIRLLSISFDPAHDTPETLRRYGIGYLGGGEMADFTVWQLAVGEDKEIRKAADFFGLAYEVDDQDRTQFNHSLVTAVISPDGRIKKVFTGNRWTPEELLSELQTAAKGQK